MSKTLLDTGPLVAFFNQKDPFHLWVKEILFKLPPPLYTCEAVLSETLFLVNHSLLVKKALFELLNRKHVQVISVLPENIKAIETLISRYQTVPMSLADACLVRMSELYDNSKILTLDSNFHIYRRHGRQKIPLITTHESS